MGKFSNFSDSTLRRMQDLEDEDPMSGLSNLSDCMLVLACGLMVALVVAWNIDINTVTEVQMTENRTEIENAETADDAVDAGGTGYVDVGRVYMDPDTGKYYVLEG